MTYLLDTCIISEVTRPRPSAAVVDWLGAQEEIGLYLSVLTIGEITKGIVKLDDSRKRARLGRWLQQDLLTRFSGRLLEIDRQVSERWGSISAETEKVGRKIPVIDGLIAATAIENGMTLVTRNTVDMSATGADLLDPWD